ncbi:MAG: hypothetical protein KGH54_00880 [Candidatus Micrarchaeota archaeon]|nr:hypothetical protein [Candidatus Micrarchaeota archaeon]
MANDEVNKVIQETIHSGGVLAKIYFDMQSETKEDLQPLMTDLISNKLLKMPGVVYCVGEIDEPIQIEKHWSTNAVADVLVKDIAALINICFNYAPVGIEVVKPEKEITIKASQLQSMLIDLAQISTHYSEYILSRILTKEDLEKVQQDLKNRELMGKSLLEKKDK